MRNAKHFWFSFLIVHLRNVDLSLCFEGAIIQGFTLPDNQNFLNMAKYTLLYGDFVIRFANSPNNGPEPDGDTIRFLPVNELPQSWGGKPVGARGINVRLEAIDALEKNFQGTHQELTGARKARDMMLAELGFTNVKFSRSDPDRIESANQNSLPGFVLSNGLDVHGRLIGFVYAGGDRPGEDGEEIPVETGLIDDSVNTTLLAGGFVFPAFYGTLPTELREHLTTKSEAARAAGSGIWPRAFGLPGRSAEVTDLESLETSVIWPKLFRRLAVFIKANGPGLDGFAEWLRKGGVSRDNRVLRLDTNERVRFSDVLSIEGNMIALKIQPELIVVDPAQADGQGR